ncbi:myocardin-related transcription factor B-like isoform X2 [Ruditapes philippinarum]|uniref:myocardin-related transcription factor B-like isoform X2 n=1 Tax=Ruditapes philippinarum TaxID=129788 RepID=UPI00295A8EC4|nr:myocardin-related transcription factor B-like isoform X2 [Ruditapes philippinarum]
MADKISAEDFGKMKVADLKKALKERGLPLTGTKSELLERLKSAVQSEEAATDTTAALEGNKILITTLKNTQQNAYILGLVIYKLSSCDFI